MARKDNTLYNLINNYTGEMQSFNKVTTWIDGSSINDGKCDGVVFRKKGLEYFKLNEPGPLNAKWFGVIGDGITDDTVALQRALDICTSIKRVLFIPNSENPYLVSFTSNQALVIKGSITIESDGATINAVAASNQATIFNLSATIPTTSEIFINGLKTIGNRRFQFIRSAPTTPIPVPLIKTFSITNCIFGTQSIVADWDTTDLIRIERVIVGNNIVDSTVLFGCQIAVVLTETSPPCKTIMVKECKVIGNEDVDMFFIKAGNSDCVELTDLTAQRFLSINGTGDGFDIDHMGSHCKVSNLTAIGCAIDLKGSFDYFDGRHITGDNLRSINSGASGISLRAGGVYNNIYCYNSNGRALNVAGFNPINATRADQQIVITNVHCVYAGAANYDVPVAINLDNVTIRDLHIYNEVGFSSFNPTTPIRVSETVNNLLIDGFHIKNGINAVSFDAAGSYDNITIKNGTLENITDRLFSLSAVSLTRLTIDNMTYSNYLGGSNHFIFNALTIDNIRIANVDTTAISTMIGKSAFQAISTKVTINDMYGYDYTATAGNPPTISTAWPVGSIILNKSDNTVWIKYSTSNTQTLAYTQVNAFNNLNTVGAQALVLATPATATGKASLRSLVKTDVNQIFGAEIENSTSDWNDVSNTYPGFSPNLIFGNAPNGPGPINIYFYPLTLNFDTKNGTGNVTQIAIPYNNANVGIFYRYRISSVWSSWVRVWDLNNLFTNRTDTVDTTLLPTDGTLFMNNTANRVVTLPAVSTVQKKPYVIKKISNNAATVTLTPNGAETIDGASSYVLTSFNDLVVIQSDGTNWKIVGRVISSIVGNLDSVTTAGNITTNSITVGALNTTGRITPTLTTEQLRLSYDVSNYMSSTVSSTGSTTLNLNGTTPTFTFNQSANFPAGISTNSVNLNLYIPTISTAATTTNATLLFAGASTTASRVGIRGNTNYTIASGASYCSFIVGRNAVTAATTGTHTLIANTVITPPTITTSTSTITSTASLFIDAAPTGGTSNWAFYVNGGNSYFNGQVQIAGGSPGAGKILTSDAGGLATWQTPIITYQRPDLTAEQTDGDLNTLYPSVPVETRIIAKNTTGGGVIYEKDTSTTWIRVAILTP